MGGNLNHFEISSEIAFAICGHCLGIVSQSNEMMHTVGHVFCKTDSDGKKNAGNACCQGASQSESQLAVSELDSSPKNAQAALRPGLADGPVLLEGPASALLAS